MSLDLLGAVEIGVDEIGDGVPGWGGLFGSILQAGGNIADAGLKYHDAEEAKKKLDADEKQKLAAAISADENASTAAAKAEFSAQLKSASADVDRGAAEVAASAQDRAGAVLSQAAAEKRAAEAEKQLATATAKAQAKPKDVYLVALMKAWTATVNKAHNANITSADPSSTALVKVDKGGGGGGGGTSWFMRPAIGPVPNVVVAGAGAGILALIVKKLLAR